MRFIIVIFWLAAVVLAVDFARGDDKLAAEFLHKNPGIGKDFDPVTEALKAEGLKGKELKQQAAKIKAGMGEHGKPIGAADHAHRGKPARFQPTADEKRVARMMRARARKAQLLAYYAAQDAGQWRTINANYAWFMRNAVGHY